MHNMYLEAHITIEPLFDEDLERLKELVKDTPFRVADLLMQKKRAETPQRSNKDTFMTAHAKCDDLEQFKIQMIHTVNLLKDNGVKVYRYKIEDIILDSRLHDSFSLLEESEG